MNNSRNVAVGLIGVVVCTASAQGQSAYHTIESGPLKGQKGRLFWGLTVEPRILDFGSLAINAETSLSVNVALREGSEFKVTGTESTSPYFTATIEPVVPGSNYVIHVATKPRLPYGPPRGNVVVTTDKPWRPALSIPLSGSVTGVLDLLEWQIGVPVGKGLPVWPRNVRVTSRVKKPFKILQVIPPPAHVKIERITQVEDFTYAILMRVEPSDELKDQYLKIMTDAAGMEEILVPFIIQPVNSVPPGHTSVNDVEDSRQKSAATTGEEGKAVTKQLVELQAEQAVLRQEVLELKRLLKSRTSVSPIEPVDVTIDLHARPFVGRSDAKIAVVEFSHYRCPYCATYAQRVFPELQRSYIDSGKIRYVFFQYPRKNDRLALDAAHAAFCADEQGGFLRLQATLYEHRQDTANTFINDAKAQGLDPKAFEECLTRQDTADAVDRDIAQGNEAGVQGTPTFLLGVTDPRTGKLLASVMIQGAREYPVFQHAIDELLAKADISVNASTKENKP